MDVIAHPTLQCSLCEIKEHFTLLPHRDSECSLQVRVRAGKRKSLSALHSKQEQEGG